MKTTQILIGLVLVLMAGSVTVLGETAKADQASSAAIQAFQTILMNDAVHWRVGDHMEYQISVTIVGNVGSMVNDVQKEEGDAVWLHQHTILSPDNDAQDFLVRRSDGKVIKYLKNGQESSFDEDPVQAASQDDESVTVPAGTFDCTHVIGKTNRSPNVEVWTNSNATAIDGTIKTVVGGNGLGTTIELTRFSRGP
jgi:hypothetical protein